MEKFTEAAKTVEGVVEDIMKMLRLLPERPEIEEVVAAKTLIINVEKEDQLKLEAINKQTKGKGIPEELFFVYLEMQKALVHFQSKEQKREAVRLLDLENAHLLFDELIQRASQCVSPGSGGGSGFGKSGYVGRETGMGSGTGSRGFGVGGIGGGVGGGVNGASTSSYLEKEGLKKNEMFTRDDSYVMKSKAGLHLDGFSTTSVIAPQIQDSTLKTSAQDGEKVSLIKLASLIEVSAKKGTKEINLCGKLSDQVDWLPDSIGKLSNLTSLDLSENRIVALPVTLGGLSSLSKLDLHANRINELPESIGELLNLVFLDLRGNNLVKLPPSIGRLIRLEVLDLSSNSLSSLPDSIGSLVSLQKLHVETNNLDELPHTIGQCTSLQELHVDYNRLKALPEAVGKIETLEILSVRYNNIRQLPTTMSSLTKLRELDASFNELEAVPESLCFAATLVKLNVSNNFADLRFLPRSIGNLESLEVLDISNNQIRVLPDSFRSLSRLTTLYVDQNPLEVPPREIAERGAQAVVQYMADLVANRDVKSQPTKEKKTWSQICCFLQSNKRKRSGVDYV
ncbi:plant intracellular Ras-group-related LRR protein 4-like [Silene latifolia]|uniref:plant intracellular Ras-group-related LRR protein 4-like n=1 Tax=Silene latifolia TaxID=37657 RepID=UPI003D775701